MTEEDAQPLWVDVEGLSGSAAAGGDARPVDEEYVSEAETEAEPAPEEETPGRSFIVLNPANFEVPKGREFRISVEVRSEAEIGSSDREPRLQPPDLAAQGGLGRRTGPPARTKRSRS